VAEGMMITSKIMALSFKREVMGRSVDITAWESSLPNHATTQEAVKKSDKPVPRQTAWKLLSATKLRPTTMNSRLMAVQRQGVVSCTSKFWANHFQ